jgi:hypothetical protein
LIYDFFYAEVFGFHDWSMRAHHVLVVLGATVMTVSDIGGSSATSKNQLVCIILTEGTNPLLKVNKILSMQGKSNTWLYKVTENAFAYLFVLFRAVFITWVNFNIWASEMPLTVILTMSSTYAVGLVWVAKVLATMNKKLQLGPLKILTVFLSRNKTFFVIFCFFWALAFPLLFHSLFNTGKFHLRAGSFTFL